MASLSLKNIKKVYSKDVVAVQDFYLEIKDKEFVVFVGPSGLVHANIGKDVVIIRMASSLLDVANMDYIKKNIEVNVSFSKERIHLFDKETECTLA